MRHLSRFLAGAVLTALVSPLRSSAAETRLFEADSKYHHIVVTDASESFRSTNLIRTLWFDDTTETCMRVDDPLKGHFEYTEFFQMPWLWNPEATNILCVGLGGASTQRVTEHYHTNAWIQTVEIDPVVARVAKEFFHYKESERQKLHLMDGRVFLRRSTEKFDVINMDAYTEGRYGASIPPHLVTKEFFELAKTRLTTNGVLAYNIITTVRDWNTDMVGATFRTMKEVFPQVYWFKARTSLNVVILGTLDPTPIEFAGLRKKAEALVAAKQITLPGFLDRLNSFQFRPPSNYQRCPILSDDFAPVDGLMRGTGESAK